VVKAKGSGAFPRNRHCREAIQKEERLGVDLIPTSSRIRLARNLILKVESNAITSV